MDLGWRLQCLKKYVLFRGLTVLQRSCPCLKFFHKLKDVPAKKTLQEILPFNRRVAASSLACFLSSARQQGNEGTCSLTLPASHWGVPLSAPAPTPDSAACHWKSAHHGSLTLMPQPAEPWNITKSTYGSKCIKDSTFNFLLAAAWHYLCSWKLLPHSSSSCFYIPRPGANNEVKGQRACMGTAETEKNGSHWWSKEVLINILLRSSCLRTNVERHICRWLSSCLQLPKEHNEEIFESLSNCDNKGAAHSKQAQEVTNRHWPWTSLWWCTKLYNYQPS